MIVLHAAVADNQFFVWGETSEVAETTPDGFSRSIPAEDLQHLMSETGMDATGMEESVRAWLPTTSVGGPVVSDPVLGDQPSGDDLTLRPWILPALSLSAEDTIEILAHCRGRRVLRPGVVIGADLAYWTHVLPLAAAVAAEGLYMPGILEADGTYRACWEPVFNGEYGEQRAKLAGSMPGACRALTPVDADGPPDVSPVLGITSFTRLVLDGLTRSRDPGGSSPTIHDGWLVSLTGGDAVLEGTDEELVGLAADVRVWHRRLTVSSSGPFSLLLRLDEPPDDEEEPWTVRYLLRAADDPSLLVPAEEAWSGSDILAGVNAREILLSSLGRASTVCPEIARSLRDPEPVGLEMDREGAYRFLTRRTPALKRSGFAIALPSWWTMSGSRHRPRARPRVSAPDMTGGSGMSLEEIVHVDWEVALGGETLTEEEISALAERKVPLVKMRGRWVEINEKDLDRIRRLWEAEPREMKARDVLPLALSDGEEGPTITGWISDLLESLTGETRPEEMPQPEGLEGTLRPYQVRGYSWLHFLARWGLGACLADDMGLGKTVQTLALIRRRWEEKDPGPSLVVCPTSVVINWEREARRFTPDLPVLVHHGPDRERDPEKFKDHAAEYGLVLTSYGLLHRDLGAFRRVTWGGIILDEAQNIKNPDTERARAARRLKADYRLALTGTPVENHVGELWSIMEFLNPGLLGTRASFKRNFYRPIQVRGDQERAHELRSLTGPFVLRRLKTDRSIISDLPDKMEMKVYCSLTREQASLYQAVVKKTEEALEDADGMSRRGRILAALTELKQVCNHPALLLGDGSVTAERSGKLKRLTEILEEVLSAGERSLLFSQFARMGELLQQHLQETFGYEAPFLHGGIPARKRQEMVDRFQEEGGPPFFILSLRAAGTGLNLTRANHVFHFDRWWNPAVENQATDRAFRIGQDRDVYVHKFLTAGTLEERIDRIMEQKQELAESIVGSGEDWLTEMSTEQLRELLILREEEV